MPQLYCAMAGGISGGCKCLSASPSLATSRALAPRPAVDAAKRTGKRPEFVLAEPKTARSRRTIHLPGLVVLRDHRVRQLEERMAAGPAWQDLDLVFCTTVGTPIVARDVSRAFAYLLRRADLPPTRFHDLRHSAATLMLAQV